MSRDTAMVIASIPVLTAVYVLLALGASFVDDGLWCVVALVAIGLGTVGGEEFAAGEDK